MKPHTVVILVAAVYILYVATVLVLTKVLT